MTVGRAKAIEASVVMRGWIGQVEDPERAAHIFIWDIVKPACNGDAYCATGVVAAYMQVGIDLRLLMDKPFQPYDCPNWVALAERRGWLTQSPNEGDVVLYGYDGHSTHVGLATPSPGDPYRATEANTTAEDGRTFGVWSRSQPREWIIGWVDMASAVDHMIDVGLYDPTSRAVPAPDLTGYETLVGGSGCWDRATLRDLQRRAGITQDAKWGPLTAAAARRYLEAPATQPPAFISPQVNRPG